VIQLNAFMRVVDRRNKGRAARVLLFTLFSPLFPPLANTMPSFVGAIDNGTTSSRFLIFDDKGGLVIGHQLEYRQIFPHPG
jgi:hypothetical protein